MCGNSSVVEHNLAKVGVASSNLVSRSMLFILAFFLQFAFSNDNFILKDHYCVQNDTIYLKELFPKAKKNFKLFKIPHNINNYKVPSVDIISPIKNILGVEVDDISGGVVLFDKRCNLKYEKKKIIDVLKSKFLKQYNYFVIKNIDIKPISSFPKDFDKYSFSGIKISNYNLHKSRGTFSVLYKDEKDRVLRVYFKFKIVAKIAVFKAKNNITNGKILYLNDYDEVVVKFDKIPTDIVRFKTLDGYVARTYIRRGKIITSYMIKRKKLIRKKQIVTAVVKNGALSVEFTATALNGGDKGDEIKIMNESRKIFRAIVKDRDLVEIK